MYETQAQVIQLDEIRKRRGPALKLTQGEDDPVSAQALVAASRSAADLSDLTRRVIAAMQGWARLNDPVEPDEIRKFIPGMVASIRNAPGFTRKTRVEPIRKALEARFGDGSLARVALMTPQEIMDLPGVGPAVLSRLICELAEETPMTVPELVTGTGKAQFDLLPVGRDRVEAMMGRRGTMTEAVAYLA